MQACKASRQSVEAKKCTISSREYVCTPNLIEPVRASFQVAKLIATSGRPFSDSKFIKKCMNAVAKEVCPDKKDVLNAVNLSASTITRRIEEMGIMYMPSCRRK